MHDRLRKESIAPLEGAIDTLHDYGGAASRSG